MLTTTLNTIQSLSHSPCQAEWEGLLKFLGKTASDDAPLPYTHGVKWTGKVSLYGGTEGC